MKRIVLVLYTVILNLCKNVVLSQNSPCPDVFQFQNNGQRSYGIITIPGMSEGTTTVSASVAVRGTIFNRNGGGLKLIKSLDDSVADSRRGQDVRYTLDYPISDRPPVISSITLNGDEICRSSESSNNLPTWSFTHRFIYPTGADYPSTPIRRQSNSSRPFSEPPRPIPEPPRPRPSPIPKPPIQPPPAPRPPQSDGQPNDASWLATYPLVNECGLNQDNIETKSTPLIIGGTPIRAGEYPWLVALFHIVWEKRQQFRQYRCGGTLISDRYVITAAHCTRGQPRVYVELGRYDLADISEIGYQGLTSTGIVSHPEYVPNTGHADISLVVIPAVRFSDKILPICIWGFGLRFDRFINGTITGWGKTENGGDNSDVPMQLNVRIADLGQCQNSHPQLRNIATRKTFCAGGRSTGPCHGDSGSGYYVFQQNKWYLRGIISISIGNEFVCNLNEYAVYVDISYYLDWLRSYLT